MKKMIAFATAASLMLGSMGTVAYGSVFADINDVTWQGAITFIDQAAELKLMSGYNENGKKYCKPRNNVTYCEAVQLMYSIMKVYNKQDVSSATISKWKQVMSGFEIPEWAYNATAYALENGILDPTATELNNLRGGTKAAPREAVGLIFGRALDTISGYDIKSNASLSYKDAAKISKEAVPYLELLNRAELMVGDPDNNFNPQNNINRAEMAVLSVKAYKKIATTEEKNEETAPLSGTLIGTVVNSMLLSNGDLFLSMKTNDGAGLNLFADVDDVTPIYEDSEVTFADIGAGDTVKVTYSGTQISKLEITNSIEGIQTAETYELVDLTSSRINVKDEDGEKLDFRLLDDVTVYLEGSKSSLSKLQDAMEDTKYDVTLTLNEDDRVKKIEARMNENNPTRGTLTDLEEDEITIQAGSKKYTYPLYEGDLEIEQDGKSVTFTKLKSNYEDSNYTVSLKLNKDNEVTEIVIEDMEDETNGTLTFLNSRRITIKAGDKEYTYDIDAEDVDVEIDGKNKTLDDLKDAFNDEDKAFAIKLDVDRDNYATEIIATSKNADEAEGELTKLTDSKITIEVGNKDIVYDLAKDVDVEINGKNADLDDLLDNYEDITFEVKLEFDTDEDVSKIEAEFEEPESGELKDIDEDKEEITVVAAGINVELELDDADITLDGDDITLKKLNQELDYSSSKNWIQVELKYNNSGKVTEIEADWVNEKPVKGNLRYVDVDRYEITIRDNDGDSYDYDVSNDVYINCNFSQGTNTLAQASWFDKSYKDYDEDDLEKLEKFFDACDDADVDCYVTLTVDSDGDVIKIQATAK